MVLLQFPQQLSDEEQMLQTKYAKLRKKKKQLTAAKNPTKPDQDKVAKSSNSVPEAKDAKEVAKKLIRSGQIHAIQKAVEKERSEKSKGFKRSQGEIFLSCHSGCGTENTNYFHRSYDN